MSDVKKAVFSIGDFVVYPAHGVGRVTGVEVQIIAGMDLEVFVIAFRGLPTFRGEAKLSTWLYRVCVNVALGRIRTKRRKPAGLQVEDLDVTAANQECSDRPETPARAPSPLRPLRRMLVSTTPG